MSGEKEVRLREGEYHRLMRAARQVDSDQSRIGNINRQLERAQQRIADNQRAAERRQRAFEHTVGALSGELRETTRDFQRRLARQQQEFAKSIKQVNQRIDHQHAEFSARFEQVDQRLDDQRREYLDLLAEQAAQVQAQFDRIARQERNARACAEQWLGDATILLDYIAEHQRHQQFAPGELQVLMGELSIARANLEQGHHEAAISTGQQLYGKALRLQAEIEMRALEWDAYYSEALTGARRQLAELESQETARWTFDTDQGSQELDAEIDYWTDGALTRLKGRVEQALTALEGQPAELTLDDLRRHIDGNQQAQAELEGVVTAAKERLIASQLRVTIAQELLDELESSGWTLDECVWEGEANDGKGWKNSYHLRLRDLGNNEMVTVILPEDTPSGTIENRVQFAYYPHDNNDARFAANQTARLNDTLRALGLSQQPLQCVPGHERTIRGNEERRDFERIRTKEVQHSTPTAAPTTGSGNSRR
jgi:hypothetical protein